MSIHAQLEATTNRSIPVLLLTLSVVSLASTETATAAGQGPGAGIDYMRVIKPSLASDLLGFH